jgi:hypothetical protein
MNGWPVEAESELKKLVLITGLESVTSTFAEFPKSDALSISLGFIANRIADEAFLQVFRGTPWHIGAKYSAQISSKESACANIVQTKSRS